MSPLEAEMYEQFIGQGLNDDDARHFAREWANETETEKSDQ